MEFKKFYHGTSKSNAESIQRNGFRPSTDGMLGRGVYVTDDITKARKHGDTVLELSVRLGKVKKIDCQGHSLQKTWHDNGYDCAWVPANCGMTNNGHSETCVYDPWRIKVNRVW